MEYRVSLSYPGVLADDDSDRLLDVLLHECDGWGPVLSFDLVAKTTRITVAVSALDVEQAMHLVVMRIGDARSAAGFTGGAIAAEIELVDARQPAAA